VREDSRLPPSEADWHGPGAAARRRTFRWRGLLWALVFPHRRHRISLTFPGLSLMALAVAIGSAAQGATGSPERSTAAYASGIAGVSAPAVSRAATSWSEMAANGMDGVAAVVELLPQPNEINRPAMIADRYT